MSLEFEASPLANHPQHTATAETAPFLNNSGVGPDLTTLFARTNIVPIITPLDQSGNPVTDPTQINNYLEHSANLGVTHLFVLGETGEFRQLTNEQRIVFAEAIVPLAKAKGFQVLLNATAEKYDLTKGNLARFGRMNGVDALIVCPMWKDNAELFEELKNERVKPSKPLVLYNNPHITGGHSITRQQVDWVTGKIAALKDSSGELTTIEMFRAAAHDHGFAFYLGCEALAAQLFNEAPRDGVAPVRGIVGATGSIDSGFNGLLATNDPLSRIRIQEALTVLTKIITEDYKAIPAGLKYALHNLGIIESSAVAPGTTELPPGTASVIDSLIGTSTLHHWSYTPGK